MTTFAPTSPPTPEMILASMDGAFAAALQPDPDLTHQPVGDQYRVLSRVSAGEPGRWRTSRTPFLREIMDCLSPSSPFSRVVFMKPAQIGGSEVLLNMLGYIIHYAPGPTMLVEPTVELAKRFSRQRIASADREHRRAWPSASPTRASAIRATRSWRRNFRAACWWSPAPTAPWACAPCRRGTC